MSFSGTSDNSVIAAIDVGTNSVHMVVARVGEHGFHVLSTEKEVVRLGAGVSGADVLSDAAIERAITALRHMKRIADALRVPPATLMADGSDTIEPSASASAGGYDLGEYQ